MDAASRTSPTCVGSPNLVLAVIDLDHFKKVNDKWGHDADLVLRPAPIASRNRSDKKISARFGGEEFVLAMQVRPTDAMALTDRIRQRVAVAPVHVPGGRFRSP